MTAYLGPAGNLIPFACPSEEQIGQADNVSTEMTLGGVQKAQYGMRSPRSWQVGIGTATPEQIGGLTGLLGGLYGPPPWLYVGPWAQVTNLLHPAASMFMPAAWIGPGAPGGPLVLADGTRPVHSIVNDTGGDIVTALVPVVPGVPVSGSVVAVGASGYTLSLDFLDAAGALVSRSSEFKDAAAGSPLSRGAITATPPAGSVQARLRVAGALRLALPAITWTPEAGPWQLGEGAPKVVARGLSKAVQLAVRDIQTMRRTSASFTLDEVGNA
jgi:hypothetical protein